MLVPAGAQAAATQAPATAVSVIAGQGAAAAAAVENFYAARRNAPLWFAIGRESNAAGELIAILRRAPIDGLASGPQLAGQIEQAIGYARGGDAATLRRGGIGVDAVPATECDGKPVSSTRVPSTVISS